MSSYKKQDCFRSWYMAPVALAFMIMILPVMGLLYLSIAFGEKFGVDV